MTPARSGRFGNWLQRVVGAVRVPAGEVPGELFERVRRLETRLAAHEEQSAKRQAEVETRLLHRLEQRLAAHESTLESSLRAAAADEAEARARSLRTRLVAVALLALAAGAAAGLALLRVFGLGAA